MNVQPKKIRLPSKKSINLAAVSDRKFSGKLFIPGIIIIAIAAVLFAKFGVIDRFVALSKAQSEVDSIQRQIDEVYERIAGVGYLVELYAHYTYSDMTPEELSLVDRNSIIKVMDRVLNASLEIDSWTIKENILEVNVVGDTLDEINVAAQNLLEEPSVEFCFVNHAATDDRNSMWDEKNDTDMVFAQIQVRFISVSETNTEEVNEK